MKIATKLKTRTRIRLAIIDDHALIRRGVKLTFDDEPDCELVGEGSSADEAVSLAVTAKPDVMLIDVNLPGDGIDAVRRILEKDPSMRIAVLTVHDDLATVRRSLKAGAVGFVTKGTDSEELVSAVRKLARGDRYISPELAVRLIEDDDSKIEASTEQPQVPLTARDQELLSLLGEGLSNAEIAKRTGLAGNTVKQYVSALIRKLGVPNRTAAALIATRRHHR